MTRGETTRGQTSRGGNGFGTKRPCTVLPRLKAALNQRVAYCLFLYSVSGLVALIFSTAEVFLLLCMRATLATGFMQEKNL